MLAKAAFKEYAGGVSASSGAPSADRASAMELDAISLCSAQFGISREEAQRYVEPQEGWAVHDTGSSSASPPPPARLPAGTGDEPYIERLLAAFEARFGRPNAGAGAPKPQSQRRNVPNATRLEIPEALLAARKEAGLCVRCGVAKYEPGGRGHNSRTRQAPVDKTTSAAEGKKKANF